MRKIAVLTLLFVITSNALFAQGHSRASAEKPNNLRLHLVAYLSAK
jgi:hypothetical protein